LKKKLNVIYDACVIYPALLRDLLFHLAQAGICRALWTVEIQDECIGSLLRKRPGRSPDSLVSALARMNHSNDCLISGYEYLIPFTDLPDPDDRHVVAAAMYANADLIVT